MSFDTFWKHNPSPESCLLFLELWYGQSYQRPRTLKSPKEELAKPEWTGKDFSRVFLRGCRQRMEVPSRSKLLEKVNSFQRRHTDDQPQKKDYISQLHCSWEVTGRAASQPMIQIPGHHCLLGHCLQWLSYRTNQGVCPRGAVEKVQWGLLSHKEG